MGLILKYMSTVFSYFKTIAGDADFFTFFVSIRLSQAHYDVTISAAIFFVIFALQGLLNKNNR